MQIPECVLFASSFNVTSHVDYARSQKANLLSERFRCKNSRSLSFSTSVVVPARSGSSWGRNVFGTTADGGVAATRH